MAGSALRTVLLIGLALVVSACTSASAPIATATPGPREPSTTTPATARPASPNPTTAATVSGAVTLREFPVPRGSGPHDVAPAADGGIWYTAQRTGELGWLDPKTGQTRHIKLGQGSAPHGVVVGPDGAPWITDGGLNAIVRVDPRTSEVKLFKLPAPNVGLNTAAFDFLGVLWFTGQTGYYGFVDPRDGRVAVFPSPRGAGPYGITSTRRGSVFYASLAGDHIAFVDVKTAAATAIDLPTRAQGARRVWSDSRGRVWVSEWNAGQLALFDPGPDGTLGTWKEWKLPGARPQAYAVFVDDRDIVWLSDFGTSALVRFDPATEKFDVFPYAAGGNVRQIHGRPGEVFAPLSALDRIVVVTTR